MFPVVRGQHVVRVPEFVGPHIRHRHPPSVTAHDAKITAMTLSPTRALRARLP
jgi:hypothetical protein